MFLTTCHFYIQRNWDYFRWTGWHIVNSFTDNRVLIVIVGNGIWTEYIPKISHISIVCHAHQDVCVTAMLLTQLYVRVSICLACGKHLFDRIISIRDLEVLAHKTSLRSPLIIDVPVPSQQRKRWCIYLLGMTISTIIPFVFTLLIRIKIYAFCQESLFLVQ